jgi:hypothetical protein
MDALHEFYLEDPKWHTHPTLGALARRLFSRTTLATIQKAHLDRYLHQGNTMLAHVEATNTPGCSGVFKTGVSCRNRPINNTANCGRHTNQGLALFARSPTNTTLHPPTFTCTGCAQPQADHTQPTDQVSCVSCARSYNTTCADLPPPTPGHLIVPICTLCYNNKHQWAPLLVQVPTPDTFITLHQLPIHPTLHQPPTPPRLSPPTSTPHHPPPHTRQARPAQPNTALHCTVL